MNILLVDDEKLILKGLKQILLDEIKEIHSITTATSAKEATQLFYELRPSIILSDIRMPEMSGLELISQLKKTDIPFKSIIISSYDDFEYAKEGILLGIENYLIKPINRAELVATVSSTITKIENERKKKQLWTENEREIFKDNFLRRILLQKLSPTDYQNWEELLTPYKSWGKIAMAYIMFSELATIVNKNDLVRLLKQTFPAIELVKLTADEVVLIYNPETISDTQIKESVQSSQNYSEVFLTFGNSVNEIEEIHLSFQQAKKLQSYSLVFGFGKCITEQDVSKDYRFTEQLVTQEELKQLILEGNQETIYDKFQLLKTDILNAHLDPLAIQNVTIGIGIMLYRISADFGLAEADEISTLRYLVERITQQKTINRIVDFLYDFIQLTIEKMKNNEQTYSPVIQQILKIVNEDLRTHHSLKILADKFNMNSAYLGQLFQKEIGMGFNQYCHHQRMKQANELIINSTSKISDIAKSFGYDDVSYFYRLYKKDYGITPNKIRSNKFAYKS
ncbi:two-component system, response regulator YesN [Enterococcus sp. AZ194]|uniref:response regulator transcription factor n=1 Tax=Enterococcus sp. AZ194 TaxID=2774629 RepID=UPI003F218293